MARNRTPRHCGACGTRLATDHRGTRCTGCEKQEQARRSQPPEVPAGFWDTPRFEDAFTAQHMGRIARAYRKHPFHHARFGPDGISQELLGSWLGLTQAQVSRIENGPPQRNLDTLTHWARVLDIPQHRLWFRPPQRPAVPSAFSTPTGQVATRPAVLPVNAPLQPSVRQTASPVLNTDASAMQAFRAADVKVGGGHLYATVMQYLNTEVAPRFFSANHETDSQPVFTGAAALTEMAGWMAHDAGRDTTAQRHFTRALDLIKLGGDRQLGAHILASMSHLSHHLNQPGEAVQLARAGQRTLGQAERNPGLAARLLTMEARGHASMRQSAKTRQLLTRAERTLDQSPAEPPSPWISTFDEGSLASETARCMRELDDRNETRRQAERIVALRGGDRTRSWSFGQLILVNILIADGKPDEACAIAKQVLDATQSLGSYLVIQQLSDLQQHLEPHRANREVAAFLSCLEEALHERLWLYEWINKQQGAMGEEPR